MLYYRVGRIVDASESISNLLADFFPKLSVPQVSVSFDDNDLGAILASIDGVKDAIMFNAAADFVETVVGDFSGVLDAVQSSTLEAALQNAFPFCIPLVIKQLLGLLEYDPSPPSFDFEVWGESMHVDMSDAQGFVDVIGWAVRFLFVFGLLVSTPKFIYKEVAP